MKVTFIYPAVGRKEGKRYIRSWKMQPLPIMTMAALTPPDVEVKFYDDRLEMIDYDHETDLVGINIEAYSALRAYNIAAKFRERGVPVVFGGYHATLMPDEAKKYGNAVVVGEAEEVWAQVLKDAQKKILKPFYRSEKRPVFGKVLPRTDILKGKKYTQVELIETSRGCKFNCNFCSIKKYYNSTYNYRSIECIIAEIESRKSKTIFFVDDNIIADVKRAKELFKALIPLKIRWISQFSINMANDDDLLRLMKASGCQGVLIGFESLNKENLKQMGKLWNQNMDYSVPLKKMRDNGLCIYATFVFGYQNDDEETLERTLDFALKNNFYFAAFNHLQPFPGTEYYEILKDRKQLIYPDWWLNPEYTYGKIIFRPNKIDPELLEHKCIEARNKFYGAKSILKRGFDFKTNSSSLFLSTVFLAQNLLAQKEVISKWELPLGQNLDTAYK